MVSDAIQKMRDIFAYVLVGAVALYVISGMSVLFGDGGGFGDKAVLAANLFTSPTVIGALVVALLLVTTPGPSSGAKAVVTAVTALAGVVTLFAVICFFGSFGMDESMGNFATGEGKVSGIWSGLADLAILGGVLFTSFLVFQKLPKAAPQQAQQQAGWGQQPHEQWGVGAGAAGAGAAGAAGAAGYDQSQQGYAPPGQQQWGDQQQYDQQQYVQQQWGAQAYDQQRYDQQQWSAQGYDQAGYQQPGQTSYADQPQGQGPQWGEPSYEQPVDESPAAPAWGAAAGTTAAGGAAWSATDEPSEPSAGSTSQWAQPASSPEPDMSESATQEPPIWESQEPVQPGTPAESDTSAGSDVPEETQAWQTQTPDEQAQNRPPQQGWWNQPPQQ